MSVSNNIIKAPIGLQEVYSLLGVAKQGTYYDVGYICSNAHGKINQWSKYKPVRNSKFTELTETDYKNARYGLQIPNANDNFLIAILNQYSYLAPRGSINNECYRLTDFLNYNHNAVAPCKSTGDFTYDLSKDSKTFIASINFDTGTDAINMSDMLEIKDMYLTMALQYTYHGKVYTTYKTANNTIENKDINVTFNTSTDLPFSLGSTISNVVYYWCAASKKKTGTDDQVGQTFRALPFTSTNDCRGEIEVKGASVEVLFTAKNIMQSLPDIIVYPITNYNTGSSYFKIASDGTIYLEYQVKNNNSTSKNVVLNNCYAEARPSFAQSEPATTTGDVLVGWYKKSGSTWSKVTNITIGAGATETLRVGVAGWLAYKNGEAYLCEKNKKALTNITIKLSNGVKLSTVVIYLQS